MRQQSTRLRRAARDDHSGGCGHLRRAAPRVRQSNASAPASALYVVSLPSAVILTARLRFVRHSPSGAAALPHPARSTLSSDVRICGSVCTSATLQMPPQGTRLAVLATEKPSNDQLTRRQCDRCRRTQGRNQDPYRTMADDTPERSAVSKEKTA